MNVQSLLSILPLTERMIALADLMGERLRPAFYTPLGDAGAVSQNVLLAPPSNEGPYIITAARIPNSGTATLVDFDLTVNGSTYVRRDSTDDGVRVDGFPGNFNAPVVVQEANVARFTLRAGAGAHGTIRGFFSGFHCSTRFANTLREMGELWADHVKISSTQGPKQLPLAERNTLLELLALPNIPTDAQLSSLSIRVHDINITPSDLTGASNMWQPSNAPGFGRAASMQQTLSGRCNIRIPKGGVTTVKMSSSAGALDLSFVGRRVWV